MGQFVSDCLKNALPGVYEPIEDEDEFPLTGPPSSQNESSKRSGLPPPVPVKRPPGPNENTSSSGAGGTDSTRVPSSGLDTAGTSGMNNGISGGFKQPKAGFFIYYELKDVIGYGSTSTCHRCVRKSDMAEFACKVIDKRQVEVKFSGLLDQFYVEIKVLQLLKHPHIIHLEDVYETADRIYMVMEYMQGGELFDYVVDKGTLSEEEASVIVRKLTSAVAHMHDMNVIHRDLKPENLLLTNRGNRTNSRDNNYDMTTKTTSNKRRVEKEDDSIQVKLIDFGLAKIVADLTPASSFLGTRGYLAPEMLQRHSYDKAIDIWALGVIVFVLLCGCLPFDDDSSRIATESDAQKKFTLRFPRWAMNLSASAKDLLHNLLDVDPKRRFTAHQALNHPWVTGRSVVANNYLTSPGIIGERRKELRSPMTPSMQAMRDRIANQSPAGQGLLKSGVTGTNTVNSRPRKNSF
jgi:serine/threonine protein kinase